MDVKDGLANVMPNNVIEKLCTELNATETRFPRTNLRMVFKLGVQSRINLKSWRSGCLKVGKNACPPYMAAYLLEIFLYPGRIGKGTRCILGYNQTKMTDKRLN